MLDLYESSTVDEGSTELNTLLMGKVADTMEFDGLRFVSCSFYELIIRFEHVFVTNLTPTRLAILGSSLIQKVYSGLKENFGLKAMVENILSVDYEDEVINDIVSYLVQTYCRMRGKDFCRQMMATDSNNLGKSLRSKLAVLTDKNSYAKNKPMENIHSNFNNVCSVTSNVSDNDSEQDEDNLFQNV